MRLQGPNLRMKPEGDDRERLVCGDCGFVVYENPKVIVGAVCTWEDKYLLCRRAIEPRVGFWTMPVGYMELHETTEQGALREVWEEARARAEIDALLAIYSIPEISQVHMIYRARMPRLRRRPGKPRGHAGRLGRHPLGRSGLSQCALVAGIRTPDAGTERLPAARPPL